MSFARHVKHDEKNSQVGVAKLRRTYDCDAEIASLTPGGFIPRHPLIHTIYNRSIGIIMFALSSPLLAVLTMIVLLVQGRPIFYGGDRLGKDRKTFRMYKFRSLESAKVQAMTASRVLPRHSNIESKMGKFLRASRLDELPQLLNVALGDMNIVGPRPVREEIAAIHEAENVHYDIRFRVKPGLVGPTQAYTSHGTSKRIRARFNYSLCSRRVSYLRDISLFIGVGFAVLATTANLLYKYFLTANDANDMQKRAEIWSTCIKLSDGRIVPVSAFHDHQVMLDGYVADDDCEVLIHCHRGLRRARVTLKNLGATKAGLTHTIDPVNDAAEHLIARYLMDDPVVAPRRPTSSVQNALTGFNKFLRKLMSKSSQDHLGPAE